MSVTIVMRNQINQSLMLLGSLTLEAITTAKCTGNQEATIIIINQIIINSINNSIITLISHILNHIFIPNLIISRHTPPNLTSTHPFKIFHKVKHQQTTISIFPKITSLITSIIITSFYLNVTRIFNL